MGENAAHMALEASAAACEARVAEIDVATAAFDVLLQNVPPAEKDAKLQELVLSILTTVGIDPRQAEMIAQGYVASQSKLVERRAKFELQGQQHRSALTALQTVVTQSPEGPLGEG
jgi:hypothetical protein